MKEALFAKVTSYKDEMIVLADAIYDHPELALKETFAAETLCSYLREKGFHVEEHTGGLDTAFRVEVQNGEGGPSIGLLAEYDALPGVDHACGHHMQGPVMIASMMALCELLPKDRPWKMVLYGTPGEEGSGGKIIMADNGCFRDIDVALMMHGGDMTTYDPTMSAFARFKVTYYGKAAHAAAHPDSGRSAFDALLLAMNGIEFMREHMIDNARVHYAPFHAGHTPPNIVPESAAGDFVLRCLNDIYLDDMIKRFKNIIEGAAMMTDTTYSVEENGKRIRACFPNQPLADIFYKNAELIGAPRITVPRGTMGSTDFGNVMEYIPGICARVAFAPKGTGAHSIEWAQVGKSQEAHDCIEISAKIIAGMAWDIIMDQKLMESIQADYQLQRNG